MTEIKIEKKKPIWPWVILVLIILAAIYFFWYYNDRDYVMDENLIPLDTVSQNDNAYRDDTNRTTDETLYTGIYGTVTNEHDLADYFTFVDNKENKSVDSTFYRTAFFKLITATKRQAEMENVDVSSNISSAMQNATNLTNDPAKGTKADNAKKAASDVAKALNTLIDKDPDNLSSSMKEVDSAVSGIDGSQTLESQSNNIDAFFDKSARLLQKMYDYDNNH